MLGESLCILKYICETRCDTHSTNVPIAAEDRNTKLTYLLPSHHDRFSTRVFIPTFHLFPSSQLPADDIQNCALCS